MNQTVLKSAAIRAARTFAQAFLAIYIAAPTVDLYSTTVAKAAATAGIMAVISFAHRFLDETAVPSLKDDTGDVTLTLDPGTVAPTGAATTSSSGANGGIRLVQQPKDYPDDRPAA